MELLNSVIELSFLLRKPQFCKAELVQTGRTSASQAGGRVFKSRTPHFGLLINASPYRLLFQSKEFQLFR